MNPLYYVYPYTVLSIADNKDEPSFSKTSNYLLHIILALTVILSSIAGVLFLFYYINREIALIASIGFNAILLGMYIRIVVRDAHLHEKISKEYTLPLAKAKQEVNLLKCLAVISDIVDEPEYIRDSLDNVLQRIVNHIPSAFEHPETTGARITVHSKSYKSDTFMLIPNLIAIPMKKHGDTIGKLELCRLQVPAGEECFSVDERNFIKTLSSRLEKIIERFEVVEHLIRYQSELKDQQQVLAAKNRALHELVEQIEFEKKKIKDDVVVNVEKLILPSLKKLLQKSSTADHNHLTIIQRDLHALLSSFGVKLQNFDDKLAPREIEICDMIKNGLPTKEISELLGISPTTVDRHRNNIRKKLGLVNNNVNLSTYLQSLT